MGNDREQIKSRERKEGKKKRKKRELGHSHGGPVGNALQKVVR
jgi:hypothetical protein